MISARRALIGNMRSFFERQGLAWADARMRPPIDRPALPKGRKHPEGKHLELVTVDFGGYELTIESPEQSPPLGRISAGQNGIAVVRGPIDETTWVQVAHYIKGNSNGER